LENDGEVKGKRDKGRERKGKWEEDGKGEGMGVQGKSCEGKGRKGKVEGEEERCPEKLLKTVFNQIFIFGDYCTHSHS